jgi:Tetratricopeptide repeat
MDAVDPESRPAGQEEGSSPDKATETKARSALEVATALHHLGQRYRSEGRPDDARRIELEAAKILREHAPSAEVLAEVLTAMRDLDASKS